MRKVKYYQDTFNPQKIWIVTKSTFGYSLESYINGERLCNYPHIRKKYIERIGIFSFKIIDRPLLV